MNWAFAFVGSGGSEECLPSLKPGVARDGEVKDVSRDRLSNGEVGKKCRSEGGVVRTSTEVVEEAVVRLDREPVRSRFMRMDFERVDMSGMMSREGHSQIQDEPVGPMRQMGFIPWTVGPFCHKK